jgi:carbon storage regulator
VLILSRRVNEKIVIGDEIVLSIVEVRGDQVKIGIEAPRSVKVFREEVFIAIQAENRKAAAASDAALPPLELA